MQKLRFTQSGKLNQGQIMLRYLYTLATLLDYKSKIKKHYSPDILIKDLFDENLDEIDFIKSLSELEVIYGIEIPEELYDRTDLTLGEFAEELSKLPLISDELYPEFFDIKFTAMKLTEKWIPLEDKTDEESIREMQMINEKFGELEDRLNVLIESQTFLDEGDKKYDLMNVVGITGNKKELWFNITDYYGKDDE